MQKSRNNDQEALLEKQVEPLFNSTLSGGLANIVAALLVLSILSGTSHRLEAIWLTGLIFIFSFLRIIVSKSYLKHPLLQLSTYLKLHLMLTASVGVLWGLYAFTQRLPEDDQTRNIVFLINFVLIAGSVATLSTYRASFLSYMLPQGVAIVLVFALSNDVTSYYLGVAIFLSIIFLISASFNINRSHINEIELLHNNKKLINDLNSEIKAKEIAQDELERHKDELELKVIDRTKELTEINASLESVIAKKEEAELSLQYMAYHDELTKLPNKNLLIDRINSSIQTAHRNNKNLGILFIDLDRFKAINDSLGHIVGDKLIQEVATRLQGTLRKEDTVSRNGGDEFVVVIKKMADANEAVLIAQKLIDRLTEIFEIDSHKIHIGASIGISVYPNDGHTALELLRNADTAMFAAKKSGGNRLQFYDQSMSNRLRERLIIENELHTALSKREFYMVYQPQVNCATGETIGFEALMRWSNAELGLVSPAEFIPLLEETGLIYEVGEWAISEVIRFISGKDISNKKVAINLSALQCGDAQLIDHIESQIRKYDLPAELLEFEITESVLINDFEQTQAFLHRLHEIGCSIALDDFGTGYTSMSYLTRLPIDGIKVDQSFIRNIHNEPALEDIVKAIVHMSRSLGIENTFEGVELREELDVVQALGGEIVQGYMYSKPLDEPDIHEWLSGENLRGIVNS